MAYEFVAASSQYLSATPPVTAVPLTISSRLTPTTNGVEAGSVCLNSNATSVNNRFVCFKNNSNLFVVQASASAAGNSTSASTISQGTNASVTAVFASATSRTAYLNGTAATANTDNITPASIAQLLIGAQYNDNTNAFLYTSGTISEVAIWNASLTAAEITSLSKGFKPYRVRPQSLVFYAPLIRNLVDRKGGLTITNNNSATVADHPRVY